MRTITDVAMGLAIALLAIMVHLEHKQAVSMSARLGGKEALLREAISISDYWRSNYFELLASQPNQP